MRPIIAIGLPGAGAGGLWLIHWNMLFAQLLREYRVACCYGMGANIYQVRNRCIPEWDKFPEGETIQYMLWIDSDNLVTYEAYKQLRLDLTTHPELDLVAGWSWTQDVMGDETPKIPAGYWREGKVVNLQPSQLVKSAEFQNLIPVEWTGLSFALIRGDSLKSLGQTPFLPIPAKRDNRVSLLGEDESFCVLAGKMGLKLAIDPCVQLPHLKLKPIQPGAVAKIKVEGTEVIAQGNLDGTREPEEV